MEKHLHIISFDVPYPPDYGGVFEIFYKIRSLAEEGIHVHLHCFDYGRGRQPVLEDYCHSVYYYPRNTGHKGYSVYLPYIVSSRVSETLRERLSLDNYPVLMEGVHTSYLLHAAALQGRKLILRLHNVEYQYYRQLAQQSKNLFRKLHFSRESRLLRKYEKEIADACLVLAMTEKDAGVYRSEFGARQAAVLPPFIGWDYPICKEGIGTFCLYQGNLSVPENEKVATWLLEHVFNDLEIPFVVAGKDPSARLEKLAHKRKHTCIVANPGETEMHDLIQKAQINILPAFTDSGVKFKFLYSVFCGRHCVVNDAMLTGTHLGPACHVANRAESFKSVITQLYRKPFEEEEIRLRQNLMHHYYNNRENARRLIQWIW